MEDKLKKQVEEAVNVIFASKEEEIQRQKTEDALQASADTIQDLNSKISAADEAASVADTKISELETQVETTTAEKAELEKQHSKAIEEAAAAKAEVEVELEKVTLELSTLKKEITADKRMVELEKAGVIREDSEKQRAKVMGMSDDEFEAYNEELASIKAQVIESLKSKEDAADDSALEDADTPPANVDPEQTAQAALNLESQPSQDLATKYAALGKAMAEAIKNK